MRYCVLVLMIALSGCNSPTNVDTRIKEVLDSLNVNNNIASFHIKDMKDYWLYTISNDIGLIYDGEGNPLISEIRKMNGKNVIVYSTPKKVHNIDKEVVQQIEKSYKAPYHSIIWYFAITKDGKKEVLTQAANFDVMPYEIPSIRNFMNPSKKIKNYEYIIDYVTVKNDDSLKTTDISMNVKEYNRFGDKSSVINDFSFIWMGDTMKFKIDTLSLYSSYIDDTLWVEDPFLINRYYLQLRLEGKGDVSKFQKRDSIKNVLNESLLLGEENDNVEIIVPPDIQIHLRKNGTWIE